MNLILEPSLKFKRGLNSSMKLIKIKLVTQRTEAGILFDGSKMPKDGKD
jgi:hypothetical protein